MFKLENEKGFDKLVSEDGDAVFINMNEDYEKRQKQIRTQLIQRTEMLYPRSLFFAVSKNSKKAKKNYNKKMIKAKITVDKIASDCFEYSEKYAGKNNTIKVKLPTDVLSRL